MKKNEIIKKLNEIHIGVTNFDKFTNNLQLIKEKYVKEDNQKEAKQFWIYQTIIEIHKLYIDAFNLLTQKEYYKGWCQLERIEITISSLKKHFQYDKKQFYLWHIEKSVLNLQVLFPYRLFGSSELLKKKKECSTCGKEISIRHSCNHIVGEIYNGEMCYRIVTAVEVLGMSLVENPGNKFSVMFITDEKTGEQTDQYSYDTIDFLYKQIKEPYENWDLEVSQKIVEKKDYGDIGRNELCVCGSKKKFKKCCGLNIGKKYPHYEFILANPSSEKLFTNTLKNKKPAVNKM